MFNIDRVWGGMVGGCNRNSFMEKKVMKIINFSFRHNCCKLESLLLLSQQHEQQSGENPGCYKLKLFIFNASLHPSALSVYNSPSHFLLQHHLCVCTTPWGGCYSRENENWNHFKRVDDRKFRNFLFNIFQPFTWCWWIFKQAPSILSRKFILRPHSCMTLQISQTLYTHIKSSVKCNHHFLKLLFTTFSHFITVHVSLLTCFKLLFSNFRKHFDAVL